MMAAWLAVAAVLAAGAADEALDPEGLLDLAAEPLSTAGYSVYVGRWTECSPLGEGEHATRSIQRFNAQAETDSLVHTPRLGLQRRQVQCRDKDGQFVENMYCGSALARIGTTRVCVMREDCSLAEWLPWRPRTDGALVRTRRLRRLPQGNGKECDVVEEVRPASLEPTAHWTPGPWGECRVAIELPATPKPSNDDDNDETDDDAIYEDDETEELEERDGGAASCGGGVQRREATCVRADGRALHPVQCAHAPLPTLVQPCEVPCPRDCEVGEWSEWGACQPTDGCPLFPVQQLTTSGFSVRRRRVTSAASGGGAPCPPLEEKRTCAAPRCAAWKALPWGSCVLNQPHTTCGPGRRNRELRCLGHDGKEAQRAWCVGTGAPARSERCRIACAGDCVVSAWGAWAACSAPCAAPRAPPRRTRRRHILAHAAPNGWPCPSEEQLVQHEACNTHACATYSWLATPWGPCERRRQDYTPLTNYTDILDGETFNESDEEEPCVEEGEMSRDVMCVQNNADVVREALCAPLRRPASRRACTIRCRRGCRVEAWMPWSLCPNTCDPGKQTRIRMVHGGPNCGATQESRDCPVAHSCRARHVGWVAGEWSTCRLPPAARCGAGHRVRSEYTLDSTNCGATQESRDCPVAHSCRARHVGWVAGEWSTCRLPPAARCGAGHRVRSEYTLDSTNCGATQESRDCPVAHSCRARHVGWVAGEWSTCRLPPAARCGAGHRVRSEYTLDSTNCGATQESRDCPVAHSCRARHVGWVAGEWSTCRLPPAARCGAGHRVRSEYTLDSTNCGATQESRDCPVAHSCRARHVGWVAGEWSTCRLPPAARCGAGHRVRSEYIQDSTNCGATQESRDCPVAHSCRARHVGWVAGEWSTCRLPPAARCGAGHRVRSEYTLDSTNCGATQESRDCPVAHSCRARHVGWVAGEWSTCRLPPAARCGAGHRVRSEYTLDSTNCGATQESRDCPVAHSCRARHVGWVAGEWSTCRLPPAARCGAGHRVRSEYIQDSTNCGATQESRDCPVAHSCRARHVGWVAGEWSTCRLPPAARCGAGHRVRSEYTLDSTNCGATQESRDCPVAHSCRARHVGWVAGEWSTCRLPPAARCGAGHRVRSEYTLDSTNCGATQESRDCPVAHSCRARHVGWVAGEWSTCRLPPAARCGAGHRIRSEYTLDSTNCGATQESRDCPVAHSCRARHVGWVAGEWSTCRLPPAARCGAGHRVRSIWCGSAAHRVEAAACAGQLVPPSVAPCAVSCDSVPAALTCQHVCAEPLRFLDATDPDIPTCTCKNVSLELLPTDSDCILPSGTECGEGRALRAARCMVGGHDVPMDVCKKFHPLTGPSRVREASTDGYTYDSEFPALLRGACSVRCARDCGAGAWGAWGPCAAEPGQRAAFRFRTREVLEEGSAGGRECGATLQRATCAVSEPRWVPGEWSPCAPLRALCGRALINRTVTCEDGEGNRLEDSVCETAGAGGMPSREATCRAPCPGDCVVSTWSEWSPCEQTKWGGRRDRTRVVLRPAAEGGADCPPLVGAEPCEPYTYSWHVAPWDDCQPLGGSPCGEGTKRRSVRCLRSDGMFVNDTFCPNTTSTEARSSWCYVPCGVDCELGAWGPWDASACACGDASSVRHMRRVRQRLTAAVWPGRACPPTEQRAPCPRQPCLRLVARPVLGCHVQTWSGGEASGACGWGVKLSRVRCELAGAALPPWRCAPALPGRIAPPPQTYQEEPCEVECGCKESETGQPGPWGAWGPCRGGARSRSRQLLVPPRRACRTPARYVTIEWANCSVGEETDLLAYEPRDVPPRRAWLDTERYHDGYIEGSSSLLAVVWTATIVLSVYGAYMLYRGLIRCLRSRKLKTVTKV